LGPLEFAIDSSGGRLSFRGPAVIVNDGAAYLSVENALARSSLDNDMIVTATIDLDPASQRPNSVEGTLEGLFERAIEGAGGSASNVAFGRLRGSVVIGGVRREIAAVARIGASFTGLEPQRFETRRMIWACFPDAPERAALEARAWTFTASEAHRTARIYDAGEWRECQLEAIELETPAPGARPDPFSVVMTTPPGDDATLYGVADAFMTLSRPGPDHTRIHTSIGFANYRLGNSIGAGMFEYSRIASATDTSNDDEDNDSD
jgi:hypothetical protein